MDVELDDVLNIARDDPDYPTITEYFAANYDRNSRAIFCAGCNSEVFCSGAAEFFTQHRACIVRVITDEGAEQHDAAQQAGTTSRDSHVHGRKRIRVVIEDDDDDVDGAAIAAAYEDDDAASFHSAQSNDSEELEL